MADPSFDVVSKVDRQEVDNALNQARKELAQRFDFRGVNASIEWSGELGVTIKADTEERAKAALDVFKEKLVKRSISMKALDAGDPKPSGKGYAIAGTLRQGIDKDHARQIVKLIKDEGPKGVQAAIQDDQVRVTGKKKDALQEVQALLQAPISTSRCSSRTTAEPVPRVVRPIPPSWVTAGQVATEGAGRASVQVTRVALGHLPRRLDAQLHRRVRREQRAHAAERVGDHHVAGRLQPRCLDQRHGVGAALELAQRRGQGQRVVRELRAGLVGLVLPGAADRQLDERGGDRREEDHQQVGERVAVAVVRRRRTARSWPAW